MQVGSDKEGAVAVHCTYSALRGLIIHDGKSVDGAYAGSPKVGIVRVTQDGEKIALGIVDMRRYDTETGKAEV